MERLSAGEVPAGGGGGRSPDLGRSWVVEGPRNEVRALIQQLSKLTRDASGKVLTGEVQVPEAWNTAIGLGGGAGGPLPSRPAAPAEKPVRTPRTQPNKAEPTERVVLRFRKQR